MLTEETDPGDDRDPCRRKTTGAIDASPGPNDRAPQRLLSGGLAQNTVLVKGLFVKTPSSMRINVTSMELIHLDCRK